MKPAGLHVAFVHDFLGLGGAETISRQTGKLLAQLGITTHYYALEHRQEQWQLPDISSSSVTLLPDKKKLWSKANLTFLLSDAKQQGIEVLFIPVSSRNKRLAALRASGLKLVYWLHTAPFDEITWIRRTMEQRAKRSWLRSLEWQLIKKPWEVTLGATERRIHHRYRHILGLVDRFITLCPAYSREIERTLALPSELASKLCVIPNTIDLPNEEELQLKKAKKIVFLGRLDPISKRVDRLVQVWSMIHQDLPGWEVEIYGDGPDRPHLEALIQELQLPRISLQGYCAHPQKIYQEAAVLACVSELESWGLVLAEAQSYGCVPIAFACSAGVRTVIGEAPSCGVLIPPYDLRRYAEELRTLCLDEALRQDLQSACLLKSLTYGHEQNLPLWQRFFD